MPDLREKLFGLLGIRRHQPPTDIFITIDDKNIPQDVFVNENNEQTFERYIHRMVGKFDKLDYIPGWSMLHIAVPKKYLPFRSNEQIAKWYKEKFVSLINKPEIKVSPTVSLQNAVYLLKSGRSISNWDFPEIALQKEKKYREFIQHNELNA